MKVYYYIIGLIILLFVIVSCETTLGPNDLGGNTDLELTKVGNEFGISLIFNGKSPKALENLRDSVVIIKSQGGIVTIKAILKIDEQSLKTIDTLLGTQNLPESGKRAIIDYYKEKYRATIDTSDKQNLTAIAEIKMKITSDGFQEFVNSQGDESKPFTIMKYSGKIGDKYEFTNNKGQKLTRTITHVHTTEDWDLGFFRVKTMRSVEETIDDPIVKKVTYIGNHKFGFIGMLIETNDGKVISTTIMPWAIL